MMMWLMRMTRCLLARWFPKRRRKRPFQRRHKALPCHQQMYQILVSLTITRYLTSQACTLDRANCSRIQVIKQWLHILMTTTITWQSRSDIMMQAQLLIIYHHYSTTKVTPLLERSQVISLPHLMVRQCSFQNVTAKMTIWNAHHQLVHTTLWWTAPSTKWLALWRKTTRMKAFQPKRLVVLMDQKGFKKIENSNH